jgi:hypothetical protein
MMADLKLSAFVQHLTSEVLAQISPIQINDPSKVEIIRTLNALSKRELVCSRDLVLEGLAVVTQRNASVDTAEAMSQLAHNGRTWPVRLVRCGIPFLRRLFEDANLVAVAPLGIGPEPAGFAEGAGAQVAPEPSAPDSGAEGEAVGETALDERSVERLIQLEAACRLRGFRIGEIRPSLAQEGPTLVAVSVELAAGESLRPIEVATKDIARELGVPGISVENDPQRPYHIRFLVPRSERVFPRMPGETPLPWAPEHGQYFGIWIGAGIEGEPYRGFVSDWPHLLVAGTTGSGKTTFLKSLLVQLDALAPGDIQFAVIDGKGEYDYIDLVKAEHFAKEFGEVLLGHEHAPEVLEWLVKREVPRRREALKTYFKANPQAPRAPREAYVAARSSGNSFPIAPIVVVIDEFAEIMLAAGAAARTFENLVQSVVQAGRSALVHLVLATQRPDANVVRGAIKANLPSRVALGLPSHHDSMTILGSPGAEDLLGRGDLIFQSSSGERVRLQGYLPVI